ncbi:hypothetical protein BJ165DRAFT_1460282 [Panaeolus papilionaceus]|nr:hypothetical protein BJ165DRAFT_1460282 [Panaeolus papilionaceus]
MPTKRSSNPSPGPKGKSNREKTGCYTCRIRRKKCDEMVILGDNGKQTCTTCHRLHIECLEGFGEKRPKLLKNRQRVQQAKVLIKDHLNNIGLVKGIPRPRTLMHGGPHILELSAFLNSGVHPFDPLVDPGSPVSEASSSSSGPEPIWHYADAQQLPNAEHLYGAPSDLLQDFETILGAVLQESELASSDLDQWLYYQQAQGLFD